jgi:polyhydroxyalkanoate synthesis regulator phasin
MEPTAPELIEIQPEGDVAPRRRVAKGAVAAALLAGGVVIGAAVSPIGGAVAQDSTEEPAVEAPEAEAEADAEAEVEVEAPKSSRFADVFDELVADGTLSQEQADTVMERLSEARAERGDRRGHKRGLGNRGFGLGGFAEEFDIDSEALREALQGGSDLSEALADQGINLDDITAAAAANAQERLDEALANIDAKVEAGEIDAERAEAFRDRLQERLEAIESGEFELGEKFAKRGLRGKFGGAADVSVDEA